MDENLPSLPSASPQIPKPTENVSVGMAGILNWIWPGMGYVLIGQKSKGIVWCVLTFFFFILVFSTCGFGIIIMIPFIIISIIDAILLAQRINKGEQIGEWQFF